MGGPREYERLFESGLAGGEDLDSATRLAELEERLAQLTASLAQREQELAKARAESVEAGGSAEHDGLRIRTLEARARAAELARMRAEAESEAAQQLGDEREAEVERRRHAVEAEIRSAEHAARVAEMEREAAMREIERLAQAPGSGQISPALAPVPPQTARRYDSAEYAARVRELEQLVSTLAGGLAQTREDVERASSSRAWRWGHGMTRALRRLSFRRNKTRGALTRALDRIEQIQKATHALPQPSRPPAPERPRLAPGPGERTAPEPDPEGRARLAEEIRGRLGPTPPRDDWPGVSIVVPTRDGRLQLERLVAGLGESTDYPAFELIVIDNGSSDGTSEFLQGLNAPFPVTTISNPEGGSFSESNARGVDRAAHDLLLFLNDDIEPFESGWLRELVAAHARPGVDATGATLLHSVAGTDPTKLDRTVQHRSIKLRMEPAGIRPYNSGDGEDLFAERFGIDDRAPAVTAACLLIDRETFDAVAGFSSGYRFGMEDVDLGLTLTTTGRIVVASGRAVLYHSESATQHAAGLDFRRNNRIANRRLFLERWGPRVRREYRLGRLRGDRTWTNGGGPHVAITVTSLDPSDGWGDWYTAHEMGDALEDVGWRVSYVERKGDAWYELPGDLDYVLSLMDGFDLSRVPAGVTTIAWVRNWTDRWLERDWFERADLILASSAASAELIEAATGRSPLVFPLATNPARFNPQPANVELSADYVFTGNHWGEDRDLQGLEPRDGERYDVYGKGWDRVPELSEHARGPAPYHQLPEIYSSAKLVLDDTAGPTLRYAAVNSRVFDALAAGTLPLTNCEAGVRELFDEEFPAWSSAESLREQLDVLLADDGTRAELAKRYRNEVLMHHTYAHRARELAQAVEELEQKPSFCIKIGAPSWERAERWGDLYFARAIERALRARGHRCLIQVLDEWENDEGLDYEVALVIKGLSRHHPKPGQLNVLWCISHPAELTGEECDGYDLVCVASERFAAELSERTSTPVIVLEQATDPSVFYPDPSPEYEHELVYVANSRGVLRPIVRELLPTEHDLAIYGGDWDGLIDTKHVVAEHIPNDELRKVYSSAKLVLCDHWDDMRKHGFVSNRIFDALACGAVVISDDVAGLEAEFGDSLAIYRSAEELHELIDRYLVDELARRELAERGRARMREDRYVSERVSALLAQVSELRSSAAAAVR